MRPRRGQSIVEVLVALGFFAIAIATVGVILIEGSFSTRQSQELTQATGLFWEAGDALRNMIARGWSRFAISGTYGLAASSTGWAFGGTSDAFGKYTRTLSVYGTTSTFRDCLSGDIKATTTGRDVESAVATTTITWAYTAGLDNTVQQPALLTNWDAQIKKITSTSSFAGGTTTSTITTANNDGEIQLGAARWDTGINTASVNVDQGTTNDIDVDGHLAVTVSDATSIIVAGSPTIHIFDISDPMAPVELGSANLSTLLGLIGVNIRGVSVDAERNRVYVTTANALNEVVILDITNPAAPALAASINLAGTSAANDVIFDGTEIYVSRQNDLLAAEFFVINAAATTTPSVTGSLELGVNAFGMAKRGTGVFVATAADAAELRIIDVVNPAAPASAGTFDDAGADDGTAVDVFQNIAFLVTQNGGNEFIILDVTTTSTPAAIGSLDLGGNANDIHVDVYESFAYVATDVANNQFRAVNFSNQAAPAIQTSFSLGGTAAGIDFRGADVAVGVQNANAELQIFRGFPGDWRNGRIAGSFNTTGTIDGSAVVTACDTAYVGTLANGSGAELYTVNIASSTSLASFGSLEIGADVNDLSLSEDRLYVATSADAGELQIVSVATSTSPSLLATVNLPGTADAKGVVARGNTVYVTLQNNASGAEFYVIDASTSTPSIVGSFEVGANVGRLALATSTAFLATASDTQELLAINVTTSTAPASAGSLDVSGTDDAVDIALDPAGERAYLVRSSGLDFIAVNVANPAAMAVVGAKNLPGTLASVTASEGPTVVVGGNAPNKEILLAYVDRNGSTSLYGVLDANGVPGDVFFAKSFFGAASQNDSQELQLFQTPSALNRLTSGTYISPSINLGSSSTLATIGWSQQIRHLGDVVKLQIKTAPDVGGSPGTFSATWSGPDGDQDGDETDFFTDSTGEIIHSSHADDQWLQFRVMLIGNGSDTPVLHDVTFTHTPQT